MLLRFNRIHGIDRLSDQWRAWETWFADLQESHSSLPALVFFRAPQPENSWITAAGTVLDAAALSRWTSLKILRLISASGLDTWRCAISLIISVLTTTLVRHLMIRSASPAQNLMLPTSNLPITGCLFSLTKTRPGEISLVGGSITTRY